MLFFIINTCLLSDDLVLEFFAAMEEVEVLLCL